MAFVISKIGGDTVKNIDIKGAIIPNEDKWIYDLFEMPSTCPKDVTDALLDAGVDGVQLTINSGGGDVFSASEIYTELMDYAGEVEARIVGVAASAATVIASSANHVKISPTASYMIHNAWTFEVGDTNVMDSTSKFLKTIDKSIASAYMKKTGLSEEELLNLMKVETWMSADMAKEKGFADEIMFSDNQVKAVASASGALPQNVIDKMRNENFTSPQVGNPISGALTLDDVNKVVADMKQDIVNEVKKELKNKKEDKPVSNWLF